MATTDYGLIGGFGEGLKQGLLAYSKQKQLKRENQIQDLTAGVTTDEDGNVQAGPGLLAKQQAQQAEYQRQQQSATPGSQSAQDYAKAIQGAGVNIPNAQDLSEEQIQKAQSVYEAKMNRDAATARALQTAQTRGGYQQQRLAYQSDKEARAAANNDPLLKQYAPRLEGAAKIKELIDSAKEGKVVSNSSLLGQVNSEIAKLETGSQSPGLGQSEKTELVDKKAQLQAFVDSWKGGKPNDAVSPELLSAAGNMVDELGQSYTRGIDSRFEFLKGGASPNQEHIFDEKHNSLKKTYLPRLKKWGDEQQTAAPQANGLVQGAQTAPQPTGSIGPAPTGIVGQGQATAGMLGKIRVSNGKETLLIDPKDAQDAAKDGYQVVK